MSDKKATLFDILEFSDKDERYLCELMDMGTPFEEWKKKATEYREEEVKQQTNTSRAWENHNYFSDVFDREFWVEGFDSPLESLMHTTIDKDVFPPPEIIRIIANQFKYYLKKGGDISLEEAFFGSPNGRGNYAYRIHHENELYPSFNSFLGRMSREAKIKRAHEYLTDGKYTTKKVSQEYALEHLLNNPMYHTDSNGKEHQINSFFGLAEGENFNSETFLRGYRRWKKKSQK